MDFITEKEQEIINLLLKGLTVTEIGQKLNKNKSVINAHIHNLFLKFQCKSIKELLETYKINAKI